MGKHKNEKKKFKEKKKNKNIKKDGDRSIFDLLDIMFDKTDYEIWVENNDK